MKTPYYSHPKRAAERKILEQVTDTPTNAVSLLSQLPLMNREIVSENREALVDEVSPRLKISSSSGSSGYQLSYYITEDRGPIELAFADSVWARGGYRAGERKVLVRRNSFEWDYGRRVLMLGVYDVVGENTEDYFLLADKKKCYYISGYVSSVVNALITVQEYPSLKSYLQRVKGLQMMSEPLFDYQLKIIKQIIPQATITHTYGTSEKTFFGYSEIDGTTVINPLYGIVEILDDKGNPVEVGQRGQVVATPLLYNGTAFVRYECGDTAVLLEKPSEENCYQMRIGQIDSRRPHRFILGRDGEKITVSSVGHSELMYLVGQFQFVQSEPGHVTMNIVPRNRELKKEELDTIKSGLIRDTGGTVDFEVKAVKELYRTKNGKTPFVVDSEEGNTYRA